MPRTRKPGLVKALSDLPPRVRHNLVELMVPGEAVVVAAPTGYRPNGDMPFAWLVVTTLRVVLCSTHRSRGVYADCPRSDINEVRLEANSRLLCVLLNDPASGDLVIPLTNDVAPDDAATLAGAAQPVRT